MAVDPFTEAEHGYRALVAARRAGQLDVRAFRARVRGLAVVDVEGRAWVLGPEDGAWYRRDRERWTAAEPPRRMPCGRCGHHNLRRHSFCVECGAHLPPASAEAAPATRSAGSG